MQSFKTLSKKIITHVGRMIMIPACHFPVASEHFGRTSQISSNISSLWLTTSSTLLTLPPPVLTASDDRDNVIADPPPPYPLPRRQRAGRSGGDFVHSAIFQFPILALPMMSNDKLNTQPLEQESWTACLSTCPERKAST